MKLYATLTIAGLALAAAIPALAGPLDGTWTADLSHAQLSTKPDTFALQGGQYSCATCTPAYSIPADGQFHPVAGKDYWDEESVTVANPSTVSFVQRRAGKVVATSTMTLSADGNTLTSQWSSDDSANGQTMSGMDTETRIAPSPAGALAISGSWRQAAAQSSANTMTFTVKDTGRTLDVSYPTGEHYSAPFGGPAVPVAGDPSGQMVQVARAGSRAVSITDKHGDRIDGVGTITVAADGVNGRWDYVNRRSGDTKSVPLHKQ